MGMMGMGNGAVFQLLPQRFPERVGLLTGLVGAAGGLGGFFLPFILGAINQRTGQLQLGTKWRASWQEESAERAGIFSYRGLAGNPVGEIVE
jgi:NNP family nitrate/nitrite transporter-like MFS transporter